MLTSLLDSFMMREAMQSVSNPLKTTVQMWKFDAVLVEISVFWYLVNLHALRKMTFQQVNFTSYFGSGISKVDVAFNLQNGRRNSCCGSKCCPMFLMTV